MRVFKKILSAIISLTLSLLVVMAGIFPAILPASAEETSKSVYEQTNVLDDLKKATVNGEPFNLTKYNFDESNGISFYGKAFLIRRVYLLFVLATTLLVVFP